MSRDDKKIDKILIDSEDFANRGFMATVIGLARGLREYRPNLTVTIFSRYLVAGKRLSRFGIELRQHPWWGGSHGFLAKFRYIIFYLSDFLRCFILRLAGKFNQRIKCPYDKYAILIHFGNNLGGSSRMFGTFKYFITLFLIMTICRKPTVTLPATLYPFPSRFNQWLAKIIFNKMDMVVLRDKISYNYAKNLGLTKPRIFLAADPAFLLEPAPKERVQEILQIENIIRNNNSPFFGFSPRHYQMGFTAFTQSLSRKEEQLRYINVLVQVIDYLVDKFKAVVCLIPQVYDPDDREMHRQIYRQVKYKSRVKLLRGEYLSDELKGIAGNCDVFFSGYLHGAIASISMGVPTITITCSDKFQRLIGKMMGQEKYIVDIRNLESNEFITEFELKINSLWADRERWKGEADLKVKLAQQQAWSYVNLLNKLIENG